MTPADRDRSRAVTSRLVRVVMLCAVALGIVGMHGLVAAPGSGEPVGHHAGSAVAVAADAAASDGPSSGTRAGSGEAPPADPGGLLALCLTVLTPVVALGLWLVATGRLGSGRRVPRMVPQLAAAVETAVLPPPFAQRLTVLRI